MVKVPVMVTQFNEHALNTNMFSLNDCKRVAFFYETRIHC